MEIKYNSKNFRLIKFKNEEELESIVDLLSQDIFGNKSIYINAKKKIKHEKLSFANIPDGYLFDFRNDIKLWVVENELSVHDSFKHIGIQLLKFATQFSDGSFAIKEIFLELINKSKDIKDKFNELISKSKFGNISEALDFAIYKNEYGFIVIIDEINEDLISVTREVARRPELLEIKKYVSGNEGLYAYDEFLKDFEEAKSSKVKEEREIDTIVCPARAENFKAAFLDQKAWWAVRISTNIIDNLKYIAIYETTPVSAIRWAGNIQSIKLFEDTGKYKIYCSEIFKIGPIKLDTQKYVPIRSRYTNFNLVQKAKSISEIF